MTNTKIKTLFLDIGGVLLTNGWDHVSRQKAVEHFGLDKKEFDVRHQAAFDTYELGKISFNEYLFHLLFYKKQDFTGEEFKQFMYAESKPLPGAIEFFKQLKKDHNLKVAALSNEPRDLNAYRIKTFDLNSLFDLYISSCYVEMRKPDPDIYRITCDISATAPENGLYIDDREMYITAGKLKGMQTLHYQNLEQAKQELTKFEFE